MSSAVFTGMFDPGLLQRGFCAAAATVSYD